MGSMLFVSVRWATLTPAIASVMSKVMSVLSIVFTAAAQTDRLELNLNAIKGVVENVLDAIFMGEVNEGLDDRKGELSIASVEPVLA